MNNDQSNITEPTASVLARLRLLRPKDIFDDKDMNNTSEKQAYLLRKLLGIKNPMFPNEAIELLPKIKVVIDPDLPYSASAHWNGLNWIISLNGLEKPYRQRFSLAHEIKHVIDHTNKYYLYLDHVGITHNNKAERQADYFAACLLMPKEHVARLYKSGITGPTELAKYFQVSPRAMHIRMHQLKLTTKWQRCKLRVKHRVFVMRLLIKVWRLLPFPIEAKV